MCFSQSQGKQNGEFRRIYSHMKKIVYYCPGVDQLILWLNLPHSPPCNKYCCCCWQLDCGIHPGLEGMDALPYIDLIDPAEIDLLLISQ